jgi:hypothetical protein
MATEDERHELLFGVRRSVRYHLRRSRFFDIWGKVTSGLNVLFGSAVAATLIGKSPELGIAFGGVVALISTIDLVVGSALSARNHADLAKRFIALEAEIERAPGNPIGALREKRLSIEADEPPVLRTLDVMCHNELAKAMGLGPDEMYQVSWVKRRLAQFVSFESSELRPLALPSAIKTEGSQKTLVS